MKHFRKAIVVLLATILLFSFVSCGNNISTPDKDTVAKETNAPSDTVQNINDAKITDTEAKELALKHFGLFGNDVTEVRFEYDNDDKKYEYEFVFDEKKYDIEISEATGKVIDADIEGKRYTKEETTAPSTEPVFQKAVTKEEAIDIAIKHFGLNKENCKFIKAERDDGKFEIEFFCEGIEYDAMVDPATGKVIAAESERAD